jgi:hypothetical protein
MAKVQTIQNALSTRYKPEEKIVIAWWDKDWFEAMLDRKIDDTEWDVVIESCIDVLEYHDIGDVFMEHAERALDEHSKEGETNE